MAGNTRFHSKHHSEQHHSVKTQPIVDYPDAATDPLGSPEFPYQGYFYINGNLNVSNKLALDEQYEKFKIHLPNIGHNIFDDALLINDSLSATGDVHVHGSLYVKQDLFVDRNVYLSGGEAGVLHLGDATNDRVRFNAFVASDVIPTSSTGEFHLGSADRRWGTVFGTDLDLTNRLRLGNNTNCTLVVDVDDNQVMIGTCDTFDPNNRLHVRGGNVELETTLNVTGEADFQSITRLHADQQVDGDVKITFGDLSGNHHITNDDTNLKLHSDGKVQSVAPVLDLDTPTIDISTQSVWLKMNQIRMGSSQSTGTDDSLIHMQAGNKRIAIGKSNPMHPVHIHGGVHVDGDTLDVTSDTFSVDNNVTNIESRSISTTSTTTTNIQGDTVHVTGNSLTKRDAIKLASSVATLDHNLLHIDTPTISTAAQRTRVLVKSGVTDALTIGSKTVVVDSAHARVGVNKLEPQATLHVGGTAIFDESVQMSDDLDVENTNTNITSTGSINLAAPRVNIGAEIELDVITPVIDLNSPVIDLSTQNTTVELRSAVNSLRFLGKTGTGSGDPELSDSTVSDTLLSLDAQNNRIGIQTENPDKTLTVQGTVSFTGDLTEIISTDVDVDSDTASIQSTTQLEIDTPRVNMPQNTNVVLKPDVNALSFDTNTLSIDSFNNRVAIGHVTPAATLHVTGEVITTGASFDATTTGDTNIHAANTIITSVNTTQLMGGNVGIGVESPLEKLHVNGSVQLNNWIKTVGDTIISADFDNINDNSSIRFNIDGNDMSDEKMRVTSNGNVGIGTTTPDHQLTVADGVKSTYMLTDDVTVTSLTPNRIVYKDPTGEKLVTSDTLYCDGDNGQVGINTTTPDVDSSLHVHQGDFRLTANGSTSIITSGRELSGAPIDVFTTTGTTIEGGVGDHLVFDLRNDNVGDSLAIRHAQFNNGVIDTVGFVYHPNGQDAAVGINVSTGELGSNAFVVKGDTHLMGDLFVDGNFLIQGTQAQLEIQNLEITDKNVVVNKGGTTNTANDSGLVILGGDNPGNDDVVGYYKTHDTDTSLLVVKAPTGDTLTLDIDADVTAWFTHDITVSGPSQINQDVTTTADVTHNSLTLTTNLVNGIDINQMRADLDQNIIDRNNTQFELDTTQTGAGLSADGTYIPNTQASYISGAQDLNDADVILDTSLKTEETTRILFDTNIQNELDNTQTGAGLAEDGSYVVNTTASFIEQATSQADADDKLDAALRHIEDVVGEGRTPTTTINHKLRLDNHDLMDTFLDGRIDNANIRIDNLITNLNDRVDETIAPDRLARTNSDSQLTNTDLISWVSGTDRQIVVTDDGAGGVVLSLPHGDFDDGSNVKTGSITLTDENITADRLAWVDGDNTLQTVSSLTNWIAGTTNQITIGDDTDGTVTLSLEQDIHTAATPTFNNMEFTGLTLDKFVMVGSDGLLQTVELDDWVTAGAGIDIVPSGTDNTGVTISHHDTSTQTSHINKTVADKEGTFRKVIQDVELDTYGHVVKLHTTDISYAVDNSTMPSLVPIAPTIGAERKFLNGNLDWVVYPNVVDKLTSLHDSLILNHFTSTDSVQFDIDNTLVVGSSSDADTALPNGGGTGLVHVVGSNTDGELNYTLFKGTRKWPRIELEDTATNGHTFQIWNLGGELRFGTAAGSQTTAAMIVGPGTVGNVAFNGQVIGREADWLQGSGAGKSFVGNLEGNADTASSFINTKTINTGGDISGSVTTDFSDNPTLNMAVNSVQPNSVNLGTDTVGQYLTHVIAGTNMEITSHIGDDGDDQTIATISDPAFNTVTATKFITTSDASLKTNIHGITDALDKVLGLQGVSFSWKDSPEQSQVGMIADQVQQAMPDVVDTDAAGHKSIDYGGVISYLIESIKSLKQEINHLKGL